MLPKWKKQKIVDDKVNQMNQPLDENALTDSLDKNKKLIGDLFVDVDILRVRDVRNRSDSKLSFCIMYCDGVVNSQHINDNILRPIMNTADLKAGEDILACLKNEILQIGEIVRTDSIKTIVESVSYGDTVLFAQGFNEALILNTKQFSIRAIDEPDNERILTGPREGFTESLMVNLSLIRRKVRTNELKMKFDVLGKRTRTAMCICYMEGIVNKKILAELYRRLETIEIDAVLDTNYINELIRNRKMTPFRATGYTEKPDVIVGKLMEGRIAIFLDGSPVVLTVPYLFIENFQSAEDYYLLFYYTSFSRFLRILGFFLTTTVPGFYIAIVAFHKEMLPTPLFLSIASERASVPFPAVVEAYVMLIIFDILRETGIRMPTGIGQALSIVGALVIGQSAVEAKLIAAPMIIVVAITGITNLLVPKLNAPVIYVRFFVLTLSSIFGFFGFVLGVSTVLIHVLELKSIGIPQVILSGNLKYQDVKDIVIRAPWWQMLRRPKEITSDSIRMSQNSGQTND